MRLEHGGRVIGYDDVGEGEVLVLCHAFPLDRRMWQRQLVDLRHRLRIVTLDFRGLGESTGTGTVDEVADDVARLLDHLGSERAMVGGLSMGGYVALAFARRHGARLAGLLLASTRANADDAAGRAARDEAITRVARGELRAYVVEMVPRLLAGRDPEALRTARAIAELQSAEGVAGALAALRDRLDHTATLATIAVPTTVLVGSEDKVTPPAVAQAMAAAIPGAVLVEIPGAGHLSNLEAPAAFTAAIEGLAQRVSAAARS